MQITGISQTRNQKVLGGRVNHVMSEHLCPVLENPDLSSFLIESFLSSPGINK